LYTHLEAAIERDNAAGIDTRHKDRSQRRVETASDLEPEPAAFGLWIFAGFRHLKMKGRWILLLKKTLIRVSCVSGAETAVVESD
jgi:hypothetical protein